MGLRRRCTKEASDQSSVGIQPIGMPQHRQVMNRTEQDRIEQPQGERGKEKKASEVSVIR